MNKRGVESKSNVVRSHVLQIILYIRVWKPLPNKHVLKTLRESPEGEAQRGPDLLVVGLSCYKWYQSQTPGGVPARMLSSEGGGYRSVC